MTREDRSAPPERIPERPIIFTSESVRAILAGTKTMTRRVVHPGRKCPFAPGMRLWVKESWWLHRDARGLDHARYCASEKTRPSKVRPPLFMPRWASRIMLEVVAVRDERLQEITEADAIAEGMCGVRGSYDAAWDRINGRKPSRAWADSPWVWCITFRRIAP